MRRTAALIIGGGPAGCAAAITLARGGVAPLLVERQPAGDALCGGFVSWRTVARIAELGVDPASLGGHRVDGVALFAGRRVHRARLPAPAMGLSRRRLDTELRAAAARVGVTCLSGVAVRSLDAGIATLADGATIAADTLFLATGKHDLRGHARPAAARGDDPTLGLRLRLHPPRDVAAALAGQIELHLFDRGYAGIVAQEDGSANICLAVHRSRLHAAGTPLALLETLAREHPALGARLAGLDATATIDAIANVPYGWRQRDGTPGLYRLGDQAAVIPSLAGEGMGIALASGIDAARAHLAGECASRWQPRFARRVARPMAVAGAARRVAESRWSSPLVALLPPRLIQVMAAVTRVG
ncbi:NAD(P)/FAD-dependent oxidoreductase [Sphingomonas sp. XXL09]|uniref:NAD(P)/FAD-dependent oxidoreductase n=1 Tax=Sphingomonas sp. XXL09 TaxID=3457787 RepID=UPI00406BC72C